MSYVNNSILDFIYIEKKENIIKSKLKTINHLIINHVYRCILFFFTLILIYTSIVSIIKVDGKFKFSETGLCGN